MNLYSCHHKLVYVLVRVLLLLLSIIEAYNIFLYKILCCHYAKNWLGCLRLELWIQQLFKIIDETALFFIFFSVIIHLYIKQWSSIAMLGDAGYMNNKNKNRFFHCSSRHRTSLGLFCTEIDRTPSMLLHYDSGYPIAKKQSSWFFTYFWGLHYLPLLCFLTEHWLVAYINSVLPEKVSKSPMGST